MIEIVATGPLNTVQDLGRRGLRNIGIGTAGAMDHVALKVANLLAGNPETAAGIEVQTFPFTLRFTRDTAVAVTGAASTKSRLGNRPLPPWWTFVARAGETLTLAQPQHGARTYVAFGGGVDVPDVLGSRSTHLRNGFGGHEGRSLATGDRLPLGAAKFGRTLDAGVTPPDAALPATRPDGALAIRVIPGADFDIFPKAAQRRFFAADWTITAQSDRAGYRLKGAEPLLLDRPTELRSYGVVAGIVQMPPAGHPIVQMADANTAGGYPRIAGVIEADLWRLAQAPLGSRLRFVDIDYPAAVEAARPLAAYLADIRNTLSMLRGATSRRSA